MSPSRPPRSRLAWASLLLVALAWGLGEALGERTLPTVLLAYLPPLVWLLPALLALGWALWTRRGLLPAVAATFLAVLGADLLHLSPQRNVSPQETALRVVSFNVARGTLGRPERLAAPLRRANADLILLQETNFVRAGDRRALLDQLPGYHVTSGHEVMTLSRLPVLESREHAIPGSRRTVLETTLRSSSGPLRVVNAHLNTVLVSNAVRGDWAALDRTNSARVWQVGLLCRLAGERGGPVFVGGDLNTPARGRLYRRLKGCVGPNAHEAAGRGPGWTFPGLFLRIDHLFARDLTPLRAEVLSPAGSDHLPLLTTFAVRGAGR